MPPADHSDFRVEILCPDLASELRLERGTAQERLGMLFEISLSLYSEDKEIDMVALLGKAMAVHITTANEERYFHGIVSHFSQVGSSERYGHYHAVLQPKLWLLGQSASCRVFRSKTVQDILKQTLNDGGVDVGGVMASPSVEFEHCVQYRETDLHFACRLMERYGLYYFHTHEKSRHAMEIVSELSGHSEVGTFHHDAAGTADDEHHITDWRATTALRSSSYRVSGTKNLTRQAIDFTEKSRFSVAAAPQLKIDEFEAVDEYEQPYLDTLAKVRMQAIDATVEEFTGSSQSLKLSAGALFTLEGHPRADQNRQYLIVAATHHFDGHLPDGTAVSDLPYQVTFSAIDSQTPFSPPVHTRKPVVQGPHLATVTEETDEYGRVLVQFHWGNTDEEIESCRARVSQNWAGKEWGGVFLPHIGHEVIVEFLDGDPDQPLVTGRVYNSESMPPLALPGSKSQSIIRDHGGNEILMEGADGAQTIRIYCPKHESEIFLGKSIELSSLSDLKNFFEGNWDAEIGGNHTSMIKGNEKRTIAKDVDENIIGKFKMKVGADVKEFFMGARNATIIGLESKTIGIAKHESILGAEIKTIHGLKHEHHKGWKLSTGDAKTLNKSPSAIYKVKDNHVFYGKGFYVTTSEFVDLKTKVMKALIKSELELASEQGAKMKLKGFDAIEADCKEMRLTAENDLKLQCKDLYLDGDKLITNATDRVDFCGVLSIKP